MSAESELVGGRYRLVETIASGGMGEVWRARDERLGRPVAVKLLRTEYASDPSFVERFRAEARNAAALSHPGIASVFDYGEADGHFYLVMELVDGEPLSTLLRREGSLDVERTLDIVGQTAMALQAAHDAGVVHRDVKPGNLLVRRDGVVKVTDFGVARATADAPLTRTGMVVGTAHYLSPEQASGKPATPASDVYSLGVVAYECLAGRRPFAGDTPVAVALAHAQEEPPSLPGDVPAPVAAFVEQLMAKDPARRPASAGDLGRTALALREMFGPAAPVPAPDVRPPAGTRPEGAATSTRAIPVPPRSAGPVGATALVGDAPAAPPAPVEPPRPRPPADPARQRRVRNTMLLVALVVVVLGALLLRACAGGGTSTVPNVVNDGYSTAVVVVERAGLVVHTVQVQSARRPGTVLSQQPAAGARVGQGSTVTLTVAAAPTQVQVDPAAYLGRQYPAVASALQQLGLVVRRADAPSPQPAGTVIAVAPSGTLDAGTTVTVTVASAPPPAGHGKHHAGGGGNGQGGGGD